MGAAETKDGTTRRRRDEAGRRRESSLGFLCRTLKTIEFAER
jgi:hypothetical protein